jgi:regulator of cell morphogenesis and NO signaling
MFKEEMRLFPMIEQGGSSLLGQLVDDMSREHRSHETEIEYLQQLMSELQMPAGQPADSLAAAALRTGVSKLLDELREHMAMEDEQLFACFDNLPRNRLP